ncbi:MAG: ABC transporter permease [Chloroflexi bacterium]|nr:ABC transporter permease [Chloroflexota bacterium]
MSRSRTLALARRIVLQFRRDRRTLGLLFVVPIVILSLLAYLIKLEAGKVSVGVVNKDGGVVVGSSGVLSLANGLVEEMKSGKAFSVTELKEEEADSWLKSGKGKAVIIFPEDFTQEFRQDGSSNIGVIMEGSEPQAGAAVLRNLGQILQALVVQLPALRGGMVQMPKVEPFKLEISYIYGGEEYDVLDYFAPALIAIFALFLVFLLTVVSFIRERTQGTIERLVASPLTRPEIVLGYMLGFSVFAFLQSLVILLFSVYALRIHYAGNLFIVFVVVLIITIGAVNLGIFLSAFARNELQAVQFFPLVILPQVFLSGVFWPIKNMPIFLQWIAYLLPLTYANSALREVMLKGRGLLESSVALNILALLLFASVFVVLGAFTLRREIA